MSTNLKLVIDHPGVRVFHVGTAHLYSSPIDLTKHEWGDSLIYNDGKGMTVYVNVCCTCDSKFLYRTLYPDTFICQVCVRRDL